MGMAALVRGTSPAVQECRAARHEVAAARGRVTHWTCANCEGARRLVGIFVGAYEELQELCGRERELLEELASLSNKNTGRSRPRINANPQIKRTESEKSFGPEDSDQQQNDFWQKLKDFAGVCDYTGSAPPKNEAVLRACAESEAPKTSATSASAVEGQQ
uniref:Uncharacterized protein n=1 Tax=Ananas comosus var. bracteatus TaxID=296719 RepID=A0A6V7Q0B5_ANACO|nr:unnamed protein product [Ananas comosus var. bracteatus]